MKADEPSASTSKPEDAPTPKRKSEPSHEKLANFSRVTPAQMQYVVFPSDSRYQPVRAVSAYPAQKGAKASASGLKMSAEKYAGGGGILLMNDTRPGEEAEFIDMSTTRTYQSNGVTVTETHGGRRTGNPRDLHISLDENAPEADPPQPFEVRTFPNLVSLYVCPNFSFSIHLTHRKYTARHLYLVLCSNIGRFLCISHDHVSYLCERVYDVDPQGY